MDTPTSSPGFDPNAPGVNNGNFFGMPFTPEEARLVLLPVPWDVTVSYREGTAYGPDAILDASMQVDLYDVHHPGGWKQGIGTLPADDMLELRGRRLREDARRVIEHWERGGAPDNESVRRKIQRVNEGSARLNEYVYREVSRWMAAGKKVGIVGGDHSVPLGAVRAAAERHPGLGILHVDAHADLRDEYGGDPYSHACVMRRVVADLGLPLVQFAVREISREEVEVRRRCGVTHYDAYFLARVGLPEQPLPEGFPRRIYISFDVDGLDPSLMPATGTPSPGGLTWKETQFILERCVRGREVAGLDVVELAPIPGLHHADYTAARLTHLLMALAARGGDTTTQGGAQ